MTLALIALGSYLVGSLPIGYLLGRLRGVDLFQAGSGNIGATNVWRVLGAKFGLLAFVLDFLKGALPVAFASRESELAKVVAAAAAFLGHLAPVFLGFRGGKGVATGAGAVMLLVPIPAALAVVAWIVAVLATRIVSLASIAAVLVLVFVQTVRSGIDTPSTLFCVIGAGLVIFRHRANLRRLLNGSENELREFSMRQPLLRMLHLLAVGFWFGGAAFFNFVVAPSLNQSYADVVHSAPSDRTAYQPVGFANGTEESRKQLASALFGAGVGPIFPMYFMLSVGCGIIALATSASWRNSKPYGRVRFLIALCALATVLAGWPVSNLVADLRIQRLASERDVALAADAAFKSWHLVSLAISLVMVLFSGILLALSAWLPRER